MEKAANVVGMAHLQITLVLESGARIGPGKAALLESVQSTGSIAAAARAMDMDYKRAWLLIDSLNQSFKTPCVERVMGGAGGGSATLTPLGEEILARYRKLEIATRKIASADLAVLEKRATKEKRPKV
ncbi:winged helix-turn-helix domain-containing protein [Methylocystis sp. ATCC 49242]|jgi:molybdate transport system regulatory protein|uniref:winged helix-turn-helix domain-containing protein n=1 Tax=Methylocystis sp. ATCC 49242 TaxID=622637 RepID=UPI00068667B9|nr:LysR family transcriptional regulator [Methylocystis sp. ATCC 49242]